ncbi:hypothetical protein NQ318_000627 [Aromia moschata]|uniref:Uncharacterized protein n=1 Tax=Aromia moschata TaxID=1265417 RepID=A0AAV8XA35_9CUCU|nr:hypothetical protein NQ318_000627 [Aromia moschata]
MKVVLMSTERSTRVSLFHLIRISSVCLVKDERVRVNCMKLCKRCHTHGIQIEESVLFMKGCFPESEIRKTPIQLLVDATRVLQTKQAVFRPIKMAGKKSQSENFMSEILQRCLINLVLLHFWKRSGQTRNTNKWIKVCGFYFPFNLNAIDFTKVFRNALNRQRCTFKEILEHSDAT